MKFEPTITKRDPKEAVAYIDRCGDLCIPQFHGEEAAVGLRLGGSSAYSELTWNPLREGNQRHFYPGDTVTITF